MRESDSARERAREGDFIGKRIRCVCGGGLRFFVWVNEEMRSREEDSEIVGSDPDCTSWKEKLFFGITVLSHHCPLTSPKIDSR